MADGEGLETRGRLVIQTGEGAGSSYPLAQGAITLGREDENDIVLISDYASRRHARIAWGGDHFVIHDLNSKNGTYVNGVRLEAPARLNHGDLIKLGDVTVVFRAADETLSTPKGDTAVMKAVPEGGDGVRVNVQTAEVFVDGRQVQVTAKEYLALVLLYGKSGALVSKDELAQAVWPEYQGAVADENIEQLIARLRRKLEAEPSRPRRVLTVRGLGYRFLTS